MAIRADEVVLVDRLGLDSVTRRGYLAVAMGWVWCMGLLLGVDALFHHPQAHLGPLFRLALVGLASGPLVIVVVAVGTRVGREWGLIARNELRLGRDGVDVRSVGGRPRHLDWAQIAGLRLRDDQRGYAIQTTSGDVIEVPISLNHPKVEGGRLQGNLAEILAQVAPRAFHLQGNLLRRRTLTQSEMLLLVGLIAIGAVGLVVYLIRT